MLLFCSVLFLQATTLTSSAFLALADKPHFSPFTGLLIYFKSSISPFFSGTFVFLSLPSCSSFSVALFFFLHFSGMLHSPPSQGCYGDVIFYILGASSNVFSSPSHWFFLLSFVSDWLLFYAEDAAIVVPRRAEVLCLLPVSFSERARGWVWLGIGWTGIFSFVLHTCIPDLFFPLLPCPSFLPPFSFILSISTPVLFASSLSAPHLSTSALLIRPPT